MEIFSDVTANNLLFLALGAFIVPLLCAPLRLPASIGEILYGIAMGPFLLGWIELDSFCFLLGEIGFFLLLFNAGMELNFYAIEKSGPRRLGAMLGIVVLTFVGSYLAVWLFNLQPFAVMILSATSIGLPLMLLQETGQGKKPLGQQVLITGTIGEFICIVAATFIAAWNSAGGLNAVFLLSALKMVAIFVLAYLLLVLLRSAVWWRPEYFSRVIATHDPSEIGVRAGMVLMFIMVAAAVRLNVDPILGAFMAWVAILFFPSRLTPSALEAQPSPSLELAHQLAKEGGGWWFKGWKRGASVALIMALMVGAVYLLSYIPQFNREGYRWWTVRNIAHAHRVMIDFRYDPQQFTHHYCSQFWAWPTVIRPVWLKFEADRQVVMSIVCFGSIVVWWPGLIYTLEFAWSGWRQKRWVWAFLAWTWLGQWLLWAGSTTGGFIYYVLPGIPLMAIILAWVVWDWQEEGQRWLVGGYLGLITLAFIAYYPFLSFMPASRELFAWLFPPSLTLWR